MNRNKNLNIGVLAFLFLVSTSESVMAFGRGGGGRFGGGGGISRPSGPSLGGGASRPSMPSRPATSPSRPEAGRNGAPSFSRPPGNGMPARSPSTGSKLGNNPASRPSGGLTGGNIGGRPGTGGFGNGASRPTPNDLNKFLGISGAPPVTSPGARPATPATRPANVASGARSQSVQTMRGSATKTTKGAVDSSGRWGIGSATVAQGSRGYTAVNIKGAGGVAGVGGRAGSITAIKGPRGNVVTTGRGASFVNGQFVHGAAWGSINGNFTHWNSFYHGWHNNYPGCWWPGKWAVVGTWAAWATPGWSSVGSYVYPSDSTAYTEPTYYDYGNSVTYQDNDVYYGDQKVATSQEYYDQATAIAKDGEAAEPKKDEEWMPLGIFVVLEKSEAENKEKLNDANPDRVLQLAINKQGIVRGNFQKTSKDDPIEVKGKLDKDTQVITLRIAGDDKAVLETGLYNLTNDEAPALLMRGPDAKDKTDLVLVRLKNPNSDEDKDKK